MSALITQQSLQAIPGILTASLSSLGSVVNSLSALQTINPAAFASYSSQIGSLMQGFDAAANITNAVGGLAQSAQVLASTPFSPSNILGFAQQLSDVANQIDYLASGAYGAGFFPVSAFRPSVQGASEANRQASSAFLYYPRNLGKYWFAMKFKKFQFSSKIFGGSLGFGGGYKPITTLDGGSIMLPLPSSINDMNLVQYSDFNPGTELASAAASLAGGVMGAVGAGLGGALSRIGGRAAIVSNGITGSLGGAATQAASTAAKLASLQLGVAINPLSTLLLQGPALKEHRLTWRLSPDSVADSETLNKIIRTIKFEMSPSNGGYGGFVLNYPSMVECLFYNRDKLYEFKPAVVTGFAVNFSPSQTPAFYKSADGKGGYPTEVEIQISIKELEAWLREDYQDAPLANFGFANPLQRA